MSLKKMIGFISIVCIVWYMYHFVSHSTLDRALERDDDIVDILSIVPLGSNRVVIFDSGEYIQAKNFKNTFFGWKSVSITNPIFRANIQDLSVDQVNSISVDQNIVYFGIINSEKIVKVRIQNNSFDIRTNKESYYWYIPIFNPDESPVEISYIFEDNTELFWPFNEELDED